MINKFPHHPVRAGFNGWLRFVAGRIPRKGSSDSLLNSYHFQAMTVCCNILLELSGA
jgi:hypothetical protein